MSVLGLKPLNRSSFLLPMNSNAVIPSSQDGVATFTQRLLRLLDRYEYEDEEVFAIQLSVEEALANAITHGNQGDAQKEVHVIFCIGLTGLCVRIQDEGLGFDPRLVREPTTSEFFFATRGRGLLLMRHFMSDVHFNSKANAVTMRYKRAPSIYE